MGKRRDRRQRVVLVRDLAIHGSWGEPALDRRAIQRDIVTAIGDRVHESNHAFGRQQRDQERYRQQHGSQNPFPRRLQDGYTVHRWEGVQTSSRTPLMYRTQATVIATFTEEKYRAARPGSPLWIEPHCRSV